MGEITLSKVPQTKKPFLDVSVEDVWIKVA